MLKNTKVKGVAIVGAGIIYDKHARALASMPERVRLVGVAEIDEAKHAVACKGTFVPVLTRDYHELLQRDDVDVVAICTPPSTHEKIVLDALNAGKYVICEKPLAHSLASVDRIIDGGRSHLDRLSTVYQLRYLPEIQSMITLRDSGALGRLLFGHFQRFGFLNSSVSQIDWWGSWGTAGGGVVATQFIHLLDLMLYVFGPAVEVRAWMSTLKSPIQSEDSFTATVTFESGATVSAVASLAAQHSVLMQFDVFGEKASVHYPWNLRSTNKEHLAEATKRVNKIQRSEKARKQINRIGRVAKRISSRFVSTAPPPPRANGHAPYYHRVLDAIQAGEPMPVAPGEARASVELTTAIYEAALTGLTVSLPLSASSTYYQGITVKDYDGRKRQAPVVMNEGAVSP